MQDRRVSRPAVPCRSVILSHLANHAKTHPRHRVVFRQFEPGPIPLTVESTVFSTPNHRHPMNGCMWFTMSIIPCSLSRTLRIQSNGRLGRRNCASRHWVAEGLWPEPEHTPLNAVIHGKIERDGYTIEKVFFASMPGHYVSGNLYRPTNAKGKVPVILCPHGHWGSGKTGGRLYEATEQEAKKQIEMGAEKTMEGALYPLQARCAMLARMGCIVFFYDMVGYADDQGIDHRTGFTDAEAILRLQSFMGLQTWNGIRAVDFVCSLPEVDTTRIGCTGASGGGTQTILLSLVEQRLSVAVPAVMVSEDMQGGCICENSPLLRVGTDNAEMISCFAPKPLGMTSANDWTAEIETRGFPQIHNIYKLYGAQADVMAWHRSFPHNYNQVSRELMYNWFNKYFKLGHAEPVVEKPFVPVPPEELRVYDAQHPRPVDTLGATELRKKMTSASDSQLAALAKDRAAYDKMMEVALRVMVHDRLPDPKDVFVGDSRGARPLDADITIEKGTIRRKNGGSAVPFVALVPRDWTGTVLIWVHPDGKASLFDDGGKLQPTVRDCCWGWIQTPCLSARRRRRTARRACRRNTKARHGPGFTMRITSASSDRAPRMF